MFWVNFIFMNLPTSLYCLGINSAEYWFVLRIICWILICTRIICWILVWTKQICWILVCTKRSCWILVWTRIICWILVWTRIICWILVCTRIICWILVWTRIICWILVCTQNNLLNTGLYLSYSAVLCSVVNELDGDNLSILPLFEQEQIWLWDHVQIISWNQPVPRLQAMLIKFQVNSRVIERVWIRLGCFLLFLVSRAIC